MTHTSWKSGEPCEGEMVEKENVVPNVLLEGYVSYLVLAKCQVCGYVERRPTLQHHWGVFRAAELTK